MAQTIDKRIKALISSVITGNKSKAATIAKDLSDSIVEGKEEFLMESLFSKKPKSEGESDV
jgi:hypothetical protein